MLGMPADEALTGGDHGGEAAFHIGGAAAIQTALPFRRHKRVGAPLCWISRGHHISVTRESEQRRRIAAPCPKIIHRAERQAFHAKTQPFQAPDQQFLATGVIGRYRASPNEVEQET